jgi:hypothetical protein
MKSLPSWIENSEMFKADRKPRRNWLTTASGMIAGLPTIINQITPVLPPKWVLIVSAVGLILTGLSAKDYNTK